MNKIEILKEKQSQIRNLQKEVLKISNDAFNDFIKEFFKSNPKIKSFAWNQYTPYFNDGESCIFSVNTDYIKVNGEYVDDSEWFSPIIITKYGKWDSATKSYKDREQHPNPKFDEELVKSTEEIKDFLNCFDMEFYLSQFGDHVEITVTDRGVNISEHEHD